MSVPNVPVYSSDELANRIVEGSVDTNRLAATVARLQTTVAAIAEWINKQTQVPVPESANSAPAAKKGKS